MTWTQIGSSALAAFLASLVEFVEALTIVLAVGSTRGWRPSLLGAGLASLVLCVLVVSFGPLLRQIPLQTLQLVIGVLLLMFGLRWLRKAILRAGGAIALHDEDKIFQEETASLQHAGFVRGTFVRDPIAVLSSFKAVLLEGVEVVFIVIATGAGARSMWPAAVGASAAGIVVILLGLAIHKPLSKVPENTLKFTVGLILSAFGVFWFGEGVHYPWPGNDLFIFPLIAFFACVSIFGVSVVKKVGSR